MVFTVYDDETGFVGTVEQMLEVPNLKGSEAGGIINAVFGRLVRSKKGGRSFSISQKDATLQVGNFKFYPMGSNQFNASENFALFLQVNMKDGNINLEPEFVLLQNDMIQSKIPFETIRESWNKKAEIRNMVYQLNLAELSPGEYNLEVKLTNDLNDQVIEKRIRINIL
jgi:hypothetical protein